MDHGKTSLLDYIRGTTVASREAGLITQHIGATEVPLDVVKKTCGSLLEKFKLKFTLPGLLFIDTPGHEAFANLRKRGGSVADLAVVVIDITQGVQPQTREAIEILKAFKVPFIIAANKIDVISGWKLHSKTFIEDIEKQLVSAKEAFNSKFYQLMGDISKLGFDCDLYPKIEDYTKKIAIVPTSAKTGEGIAELLAVLTGLAQKYLEKSLKIEVKGPAKGTILEIKEEKGIGTTADAIIYNGTLKKGDTILLGGLGETIQTKVRALLKPLPLTEIREKRAKFQQVDEVHAATGVRIVALELDKAIAGAPLRAARSSKEIEAGEKEIQEEIEEILVETTESGIILKTDTLGSLEALAKMLKDRGVLIQKVGIGDINKKDIMEAAANIDSHPMEALVLGFNVKVEPDVQTQAESMKVGVITDNVVYKLIERYEDLIEKKKKMFELEKLAGLTWPAKFKILAGYVFRQSHPAIFGVEVMSGKLKPKVAIMKEDGKEIGEIKTIESEGEKLEELKPGEKAAISVEGITVGRQVKEGDILFVSLTEAAFRTLKDKRDVLTKSEIGVLKEIAELKRREKATWGL